MHSVCRLNLSRNQRTSENGNELRKALEGFIEEWLTANSLNHKSQLK